MIYDEYTFYTIKYKKQYGNDTVILMEVGSFWEIYNCDKNLGADIYPICKLLNIQVSKKNKNILQVSAQNPLMAGFPSVSLGKFLPILISNNYTVVLVSQTTPPPNPIRNVTNIYSKGTYIDDYDDQYDNVSHSNMIMSAYLEKNKNQYSVGVSIVDLSTGNNYIHESHSLINDIDYPIEELYRLYNDYIPKELILTGNCSDIMSKYIKHHKHQSKLYINDNNYKEFGQLEYQSIILEKVFENKSMLSIIENLNLERHMYGTISYVILLEFCLNHNESICNNIEHPIINDDSNKLHINFNGNDQIDIKGLNALLNKCKTSIGKRYMWYRLCNPLCDVGKIMETQSQISIMLKDNTYDKIRNKLSNIYDVDKIFRRLNINPSINDLVKLYESIKCLDEYKNCKELIKFIDNIFDMQKISNEPNYISPFKEGYSSEIDMRIKEISLITQKRETFLSENNYGIFKLDKTDKEGYYLHTTTKKYNDVKNKININFSKDILYTKPLSGSVKIFHKYLEKLDEQNEKLSLSVRAKISSEFLHVVDVLIKEHTDNIKSIIRYIQNSDFHANCAYIANKFKYCKPEIINMDNNVSYCKSQNIRHPIIERVLYNTPYIGNDIDIESNGMLLYGINAAGKSSLMKAIGLNIIMAQCGMYVAADSFTIAPYTQMFCRITKGDDLYMGHSTFMVEMLELRNILKRANSRSIVLGDELCSGTEFTSAIAIVASGIHYLCNKNVAFIFATHLHELMDQDFIIEKCDICHLDVYYDKVNECLIYNRKLKKGAGSSMYGLEVCRSFNMPLEFIDEADRIREKLVFKKKQIVKSRYNAKTYRDKCKICNKNGDHMHHIQEQELAVNKYIGNIHMNAAHNLVCLCTECHHNVHNGDIIINGYKMTNNGVKLDFIFKK